MNSLLRLGRIFRDGTAGQADKVKAYIYFATVSRAFPEAKTAADSLRGDLSKKDIQRADKKILELTAKIRTRSDTKCNWSD